LEPTTSDLQAQIDRLALTVRQGRDAGTRTEPVERQLSLLAERCAEILSRWTDVDQRHAHALGEVEARLIEWAAIEDRLEHHSAQRMQELEKRVEHEWKALRQAHEEPIRQLREQSAALGEICARAAQLALQGFERAEARFAALEHDLQAQLGQLSRDIQTAVAELRRDGARSGSGADVAPFPIEGVLRIHDELRGGDAPSSDLALARVNTPAASEPPIVTQPHRVDPLPETTALSDRIGALEREVTSEREEIRESATRADRLRRDWRLALGALAAILIVGFFGWQHVSARLDDAATRAAAAERQAANVSDTASRQIASARAEADRQIAQARDAASKAEIVGNVLAAPDLIRFNLVGTERAADASGQVLWSRSRGFVVSAVRLPAAPTGSTYQVWLSNTTTAVSAGTFAVDATGRATLAADNLQNAPRPVTAVSVTLEPAGGKQTAPTGSPVLVRVPQPQ
jgi:anti-sigma-K factor RskA